MIIVALKVVVSLFTSVNFIILFRINKSVASAPAHAQGSARAAVLHVLGGRGDKDIDFDRLGIDAGRKW